MSEILKSARRLAKQGFSVIWLKPREKAPVGRNWTKKPTMTPDELEDSYQEGCNAGVRLGLPSRIGKYYLCAIDVDIRDSEARQEALDEVERLFGIRIEDFPTVISGSGKGSMHLYALTEEPHHSRSLWHTKATMIGEDSKKHWCAEIDFFGTGKQVAIPPSIHPSGRPYRWKEPFDPDQLPILDEDRLSALLGDDGDDDYDEEDSEPLNMSVEEGREVIRGLAHLAENRPEWRNVGFALKHEYGPRVGWRLFDEFSKLADPKKYDPVVNRQQWNSFGRTLKGRPVTMRTLLKERKDQAILDMLDEKDFLPDDEPAGITMREAKDIFDEIDAAMDDVDDKASRDRALAKVPKKLWTIPGMLGEAVDLYNQTCVQYQRQFAVQTALALGSVVLGRHHKADGMGVGNYSSLYLMIVGDTSAGKEFSRTFIRRALGSAGMLGLMVASEPGYGSAAGLFTALYHKPRHILIEDEIGMRRASNARSPDPHADAIAKKLTSIFGDLEGVQTPPTYSMRGKTKATIEEEMAMSVERPAITTLAMTTPDVFYDNLSQAQVEDGFLNRILIVRSPLSKGVSLRQGNKPVPVELIKWMQDYGMTDAQWNIHDRELGEDDLGLKLTESPNRVEPAEVYELTDAAKTFEKECEQEFVKLFHQHKPLGLQNIFARSHEIMLRISLIVALSCRKKRIDKPHVEWAFEYVRFYALQMAKDAADRIGSSPLIRIADEIYDLLLAAGPKGLPTWEIVRKNHRFAKLTTREQEEILERLTTNMNVREIQVKQSGRGRKPATRYIHPDYDKE